MIIFAHHHKVLDGIQEFIRQKGIGFVRIDGNTLPNDRQSAVNSFQMSSEVQIAVIGVTAGGVGLNLSSAQTVVFLELPPSSSWMLQAEDRAHRQGQKNAVNIYYFCAKDTIDDMHWQYLNTSLYRVSSTTNGKRDAIREIGVDDISYFESSDLYDGSLNNTLGKSTSGALSPEQRTISVLQHDTELIDGSKETDLFNRESDKQKQSQISNGFEGQLNDTTEAKKINSCLVRSLRFEVSQYTQRIHLYTCTSDSEYRPRPLFKSFRPEELDTKSPIIMDNDTAEVDNRSSYTEVLLMFINQWKKLRPIQRRKLLGKPLQLPLAVELCYLKEGVNHDNSGLLKSKSKRRNTPFLEISRPLPDNAEWKKVSLAANHGRKEKEYIQGWSIIGEPLCKLCQSPCCGENARLPQFFEDLFCNLECYEEYRLRTSSRFIRQELFRIEHGVCTSCQLNCHNLVKCLKPLPVDKRREYIRMNAPKLAMHKKLLDKLANDPSNGNAWHADHIIPVFRGGGECLLENLRTLCVACHYDVTAAQHAERRTARAKSKKRLKEILKTLQNEGTVATTSKPEGDVQEEIVEEELLVNIPGSAYSMPS
ncbi:hypothetical protein MLD38_028010 [Melastoma candidum]|uniref:Uncharacterized protein n=1 Tax=Melastoma candidum TaxID=119954 RepID=A0ACB9MZW2_9MYRT|nr:hypothetical protein MLD38_028010 [Melastoma candidum]